MILQQIIGIISLSLPAIVAYQYIPTHLLNWYGIGFYSFLVGTYVTYIHYCQAQNLKKALLYAPTGHIKEQLELEISRCGMQPDNIFLRYSYLNDNIATSTMNTICIDPMVWKEINADSEVATVNNIIERQVLPNVPTSMKAMRTHIAEALCPAAQRFIFRHELGHTYHAYTPRILFSLYTIGCTMSALGLYAASCIIPLYGAGIALIGGMIIANITDTLLGYVNNALLKVYLEKQADRFAAQFSTKEELESAAQFFEQYEQGAKKYRAATGLAAYLPITALTGHPKMADRVAYLRKAAIEKQSSASLDVHC